MPERRWEPARTASGLGRFVRRVVRDATGSVGVILLYHRVVRTRRDPQLLAVTPARFAEHLDVLRRTWPVVRIEALSARDAHVRRPHRWVALTLDDGYVDAEHEARPLLERFDVPATVYVTAGQVGRADEFWWDELEHVLLDGDWASPLELRLGSRTWRWEATRAVAPDPVDDGWHIEQSSDPSPRHRAYREAYALLHELAPDERHAAMAQLRTWARAPSQGRATHRALSEPELQALGRSPLVDIGAHTVTHPRLATLARGAQRHEIADSRRRLEDIVGPVRSFAYPHGSYDADTVECVQHAGFETACSSETGAVRAANDVHRLPRLGIRDWDGDQFASVVHGWFRLP